MDLKAVQAKLDANSSKSNTNDELKNLKFKPSIGRQTVRILPYKFKRDFPFIEMYFYYNIGKRFMASPKNWGNKDPIEEFVTKLKQSNDQENWKLVKQLYAKKRTFVPVLVRGSEEEGVKFWEFGVTTYNELLQLAADEEIGDFTDVMEGRDIKLNTVGPDVTGTTYNKTTTSPSLKESPLADTKEEIEALIESQPNIKDLYHQFSHEEVKQALQDWLTPDGDDEEVENTSTSYEEKTAFPTKTKTSVEDEFDAMFS